MTTVPIPDTPIATIMAAVGPSMAAPKREDREYRYYQCRLEWDGLKCKKVSGAPQLPDDDLTKLLFVKSFYPERLDAQILKCKWMPNKVVIQKNDGR